MLLMLLMTCMLMPVDVRNRRVLAPLVDFQLVRRHSRDRGLHEQCRNVSNCVIFQAYQVEIACSAGRDPAAQ
jgi:hypothetical protein